MKMSGRRASQIVLFLWLAAALSGCIRVGGGAGYWYDDPKNNKTHSGGVSLDSARLVP